MPSTRFPTTIGECTISWDVNGLTGLALPDPTDHSTTAGKQANSAGPDSAPAAGCPPAIAALVVRIQRHLAGELQDFSDLPYDWARVTPFQQRVLRALLAIGPGRTATYGALARAISAAPGAARAIGGAVGSNPWPLLVPCHRILGSTGKLTGYSAPGGVRTKAKLLALEGVQLAVV